MPPELAELVSEQLDLADSEANDAHFGRPVSGRGKGAFPQARVAGLTECGTHAVFAADVGPLSVSEQSLSRQLLTHLRAGMLLPADRGFYGFELCRQAAATGADLLWRVRKNAALPMVRALADGSYLSDDVRTAYLEGRSIAALARDHDVSRGAIRTCTARLRQTPAARWQQASLTGQGRDGGVTLWNTFYMDRALDQRKAEYYPLTEEDVV